MLCLKLDKGKVIQIGPDIFIMVLNKSDVTLGIVAPEEIPVKRAEVPDTMKKPKDKK
jgi:carbon storage regulator CsrA